MSAPPLAISIHALETSGDEGLVADAGVFAELDCRAVCVATAVASRHPVPPDALARQLDAVRAMGRLGAARVGYVHDATQAELIVRLVKRAVPNSTVVAMPAGNTESDDAIRQHLYPAARVVVVRAVDLAPLIDRTPEDLDALRGAAAKLRERGARAVAVIGWLARGRVIDLLDDEGDVVLLDTARIQAPRLTGLGGAYAAALTAHLARDLPLSTAVEAAQRYVGFRLARGR